MKKTLCLLILIGFLAGIYSLSAQEESDTVRVLLPGDIVFSGFGAPFVEFSSLNGQFAVFAGAGGALMINRTIFIGAYFQGLTTIHHMEELATVVNIEKPRVSFEHGGIWMGYVIMPKKAIHGGISLKLGWGEIDLEGDELDDGVDADYDFTDRIFNIQPQVEVEFNMTKWFRINAGVGYRFVTGIDATYLDDQGNRTYFYSNNDFDSFIGTVTLIFGGGKKQD